jgi:hypothetical protein
MPHALIQLVSEQTLPNIFPVLALDPARNVLLHTPQTLRQCSWIEQALALAGMTGESTRIELPDNPDHHATGRAVLEQIDAAQSAGLSPLVNFTGGTKLMSIGGFAAAHQKKVAACYLDSAHRAFISATPTQLPSPLDSSPTAFRRITERLTVSILTAAHGMQTFKPGRDPAPWLPTARLLANNSELEATTHNYANAQLDEGRRQPADYARILNTPLDDLPDPLIEPLAEAGFITLREGHWYIWHADAATIARWATLLPPPRCSRSSAF